jgi:hypothetical protein
VSPLCVHWCAATKSAESCRPRRGRTSASRAPVRRREYGVEVPRRACAVNEAFPPSHRDTTGRRHEHLQARTGVHDDDSHRRWYRGAFACSGSRCSSP